MTTAIHNLTSDEAAARARQMIGAGPAVPAIVWPVTRLDRVGERYYLVVLGDDRAAVGVAAIKVGNGDVMSWARLSGTSPHLSVDASDAARLAGLGEAAPELVWQPCQASASPLYPLWRVTGGGRSVFVDQQGKCWDRLAPKSA